ncbi:chromate transporter [Paenibacillus sp.]|uniref:chromate transporter n=1 Tax=Paenibacillus sp. TaxID=58172 RepID=UPI002D6B4ED3|nr:chromate transporter [Paenibacillus sp.]HZG56788.1 chromate transporter [Paenibacillus sp.]
MIRASIGLSRWSKIPAIFLCFLKIGPVTFGGGYAMIPLIEKEVVERRKWLETKDVTDVFAVAESVPGAIAINSATFIGYRLAGVPGAIAAMVGVLLPTFLIVLLLSIFFLQVHDHPKVEAAFQGIRAAIVALICYAGYKIGKTAVLDKTTLGVVVATVAVLFLSHVHPVVVVVSGFFVGAVLVALRGRLGLQTKLEPGSEEREWGYMMGDGI